MIENLHTLLTSIEDLYETGKFNGPEERFFGMVEKTASMRPVSSSANSNNLSYTLNTANQVFEKMCHLTMPISLTKFIVAVLLGLIIRSIDL